MAAGPALARVLLRVPHGQAPPRSSAPRAHATHLEERKNGRAPNRSGGAGSVSRGRFAERLVVIRTHLRYLRLSLRGCFLIKTLETPDDQPTVRQETAFQRVCE